MFIRNKLLILLVIITLGMLSSSNQVLSFSRSNYSNTQSIAKNTGSSDNVTIIIYNYEEYYSNYQIQQINNYINTVIKLNYPSTNLTVINNSADPNFNFSNILESIVTLNHPNYIIIMGGVSNTFSQYLAQVRDWMTGTKYPYVKEFALINYMQTQNEIFHGNYGLHLTGNNILHNVTLANFDYSQIGFMSGVQASFLTKTDKIGIILDHSMDVNFQNKINSPEDALGNPIYSFDRANFVAGFIAGVQYSSEVYLKGVKIDITSEGFNINSPITTDSMDSAVQKLASLGNDVIFNMETYLDGTFMQKAQSLNIQTGIFGPTNASPTFSFNQNNQFIIKDLLNQWNLTSQHVDWTYNLANSTILSLSSMKDSRLNNIKTLILNGTILIHNYEYYSSESKIQNVPSFQMFIVAIAIIPITIKRKLRK